MATPTIEGERRPDGEMTLRQAVRWALAYRPDQKRAAIALTARIDAGDMSKYIRGRQDLRGQTIDRLLQTLHLKIVSMDAHPSPDQP